MTATMTTDEQALIQRIREIEDYRLHNCLFCSQAESIIQDVKPLLDYLRACNPEAYRIERDCIVVGLISFIASFVEKTIYKSNSPLNSYLTDRGLSEVKDDLYSAKRLIVDMHRLDMETPYHEALDYYSSILDALIRKTKTIRRKVLAYGLYNRIRFYYLDGPVKVGLIAFGVIILLALIKVL